MLNSLGAKTQSVDTSKVTNVTGDTTKLDSTGAEALGNPTSESVTTKQETNICVAAAIGVNVVKHNVTAVTSGIIEQVTKKVNVTIEAKNQIGRASCRERVLRLV